MSEITYSQSKIKTWRRCQKAYDYKYNQGLTKRTGPATLTRGVTFHEMLDAPVQGKDWKEPLVEYKKFYQSLWPEERDGYSSPEELESLYIRYQKFWENDGLDYQGISEFEVKVEYRGKIFKGIIDKLPKDSEGRVFVMDHKCLDSDHLVNTTRGAVRMGDLTLSDQVVSSSGGFIPIKEIVHQTLPMVKISLTGGKIFRCTPEHRWPVLVGKSFNDLKPMVLRTYEILEYPYAYLIPNPPHLDRPEKKYPISPYVLGSLLGDGSLGQGVRFTSSNKIQLKAFESELPPGTLIKLSQKSPKAPSYYLRGFKSLIRQLGLNEANSFTKFIPPEYLQGSFNQRLSLLQGLMDTDGSVYKGSSHLFTTISPQLAQGVKELVWSLGGVVLMRRPKAPHYQGGKTGQTPYLVKFTLPTEVPPPYRHPEKLKRMKLPKRFFGSNLRIRSIEEYGKGRVTDISVDSPDHLFSVEGVLTHNTHKIIPDEDTRFSDIQTVLYFWALQKSGTQVDGVLWDYIRTKPPAIPEQLKSGDLSRRANIDTDWDTYLWQINRCGLDPKDYEDMRKKLHGKEKSFFQRVKLPNPSKDLILNVVEDFFDTADEIESATNYSRNMTRDCKSCSYYTLCSAEVRGLDGDFIKKKIFTVKPQ